MIVYSVTVNIDESVHDEWKDWMLNEHIPEVMQTGVFTERRMCKLLSQGDTGITYNIQYVCKSLSDYDKYLSNFAPMLQQKHSEKFKDKFAAFRTLLEVID